MLRFIFFRGSDHKIRDNFLGQEAKYSVYLFPEEEQRENRKPAKRIEAVS